MVDRGARIIVFIPENRIALFIYISLCHPASIKLNIVCGF